MVYYAKSDDSGTLTQFTSKKAIKIITRGTSVPANYQVKVTVDYEPGMQSLFQDIRFNTKAGVYIDYWIKSKTASTTADVWLELPDAIADPGSDTIWMYYGNAILSDGGIGADTFKIFDHFEGSSLDGKWTRTVAGGTATVSNSILTVAGGVNAWEFWQSRGASKIAVPFIAEYYGKINLESSNPENIMGLSDFGGTFFENDAAAIGYIDPFNEYMTINDAAQTDTIKTTSLLDWTHIKIILDGTNVTFIEGENSVTVTSNVPDEAMGFAIGAGQLSGIVYLDYVFIRTYIANEPTTLRTTSGTISTGKQNSPGMSILGGIPSGKQNSPGISIPGGMSLGA